MDIYVDYDDCLCETAKHFSGLVADMFGKIIPYEDIRYFNLKQSFSLSDEEYRQLMIRGHEPEILLSYEETPGAAATINRLVGTGHNVSIITGRPYSSFEASRTWLDRHGLERVELFCLNKYGRDGFINGSDFSLELEDYYKLHFDYAIEDSPEAFKFFGHLPGLKVLVYDRPWNRECEFPGENYHRCNGWDMIGRILANNKKEGN